MRSEKLNIAFNLNFSETVSRARTKGDIRGSSHPHRVGFAANDAYRRAPVAMEDEGGDAEAPVSPAERHHRDPDGTLRRDVWPRIVDSEMRIPNHYAALLALAGETPETAQQIEKDLPRTGATFAVQGLLKPGTSVHALAPEIRTAQIRRRATTQANPLPQHRPFAGLPMWESLRNVLTAYAAHDPVMGYVQSMNFIAAFLLLAGLREEDAFWCLIALVDRVVPGYFSEGMAAAKLDQRVFARLLHIHLPAVGLHLETLAPDNIVCGIISSQWLLTLFVNVLPTAVTMRIWDRVFVTGSRAPLFAACISLLAPRVNDVLGCNEMGECIELLQGLGDRLDDSDASVFLASVDAHLAHELSPERVLVETARERGRHRRPSDAGLPESVLAIPPVTEIDELTAGLESDLADVAGPKALRRMDAEDGKTTELGDDWEMAGDATDREDIEDVDLFGEVEMLRDMGDAPVRSRSGSPEEYGDESGSESPGRYSMDETRRREESQSMASGLRLSVAEVDGLASRLCALDERMDSLPVYSSEYRRCVKVLALRPLSTVHSSRLDPLRDEFVRGEADFRLLMQRALALGSEGLAWRQGVGVKLCEFNPGGALWSSWADSLFEHVVLRADGLLEILERIATELHWIVEMVRGKGNKLDKRDDDTPDTPPEEETQTSSAGGRRPIWRREPDPPPNASTVTDVSAVHLARMSAQLKELIAGVNKIAALARGDLPALASNAADVRAGLRRQSDALATAVSEWSAAAESRRRRKTASTLRAVTTATRDATGAFAEGAGDEDEDGEELEAFEDTPEALEAAYEDEASRLAAAEAAIAAAVKSISRRKTAVERDSKAAAEVREHAAAQKSAADEREARVEKVAEAVRLALEERCAQSHLDECESLANHVDMLGRESLRLWSDLIGRWADFVRKATAEVAMGYVTVVDASTQCAQDLIEENHKIAAAKAAAQANNHGIGGMLSDAAEFVASEAGLVGGSSPAAPGSSGGGLGSLRDRMREQSKKAMSTMNSLGGNLSHTLQGATGGFGFTRFKGGKDEKGEVGGSREDQATELRDTPSATPESEQPRGGHAEIVSPLDAGLGELVRAVSLGAGEGEGTPKPRAESRQLQTLRADIGKLEERRDTLVTRKQALRELIMSQTRAKLMSST